MNFTDVSISLPTKVQGTEAEEEWEEVHWTTWTSGTVMLDPKSYLLVFNPSAAGSVKSKPLGNLQKAAAVEALGEETKTYIVTTSESLHRMYRFTFSTARQAAEFAEVAKQAEAAHEAAARLPDSGASGVGETGARLASDIKQQHRAHMPLVFTGATLLGQDPGGASGSEVLLGAGAVALVDPPQDTKSIGNYELWFFSEEEGVSKPQNRFTLAPKMKLDRQANEGEGEDAVSLTLNIPGMPVHTICFEDSDTAQSFSRDFGVRQRLMDVSLMTAKKQARAENLRGEIEDMRKHSFVARLVHCFRMLMLIAFLAVIARACFLYVQDAVKKDPREYVNIVSSEAQQVLKMCQASTKAIALQASHLLLGTVDGEEVRRCSKLSEVLDIRNCIDMLTGYVPVSSDFL
eukprot:TRINITY_DN9765_c0_g2_i1.p1 TRINITY_DN9765_c0_g2~~TRINITY_DN9765_c0_g2_i1.p1  ORF type:complete len:404 (+),score=88.20 TRINITY_DN9765_c0_g2_i1:94-1305(+)